MRILSIFLIIVAVLLLRTQQRGPRLVGASIAILAAVLAIFSLKGALFGGGYAARMDETKQALRQAISDGLGRYDHDARVLILVRPHTGEWPALTHAEQQELSAIRAAVPSGNAQVIEMKVEGSWRALEGNGVFMLDEQDPQVRAALVNYALTRHITPEVFSSVPREADVILSILPLPVDVSARHFPRPHESLPVVLLAHAPPMQSPAMVHETAVDLIIAPIPPGLFEASPGPAAAAKTYDPIVYQFIDKLSVDDLFSELLMGVGGGGR